MASTRIPIAEYFRKVTLLYKFIDNGPVWAKLRVLGRQYKVINEVQLLEYSMHHIRKHDQDGNLCDSIFNAYNISKNMPVYKICPICLDSYYKRHDRTPGDLYD